MSSVKICLALVFALLLSARAVAAEPPLNLVRGEATQGGLVVFQLADGFSASRDDVAVAGFVAAADLIAFNKANQHCINENVVCRAFGAQYFC